MKKPTILEKLSFGIFSTSIAWIFLLNPLLTIAIVVLIGVILGKYSDKIRKFHLLFLSVGLIILIVEGVAYSPIWEEAGWFVFGFMSILMIFIGGSGYSWGLRNYSKKQ